MFRTWVKRVMRGEPPRPDMGAVEKTASSLPNLKVGHGSMPETLISIPVRPAASTQPLRQHSRLSKSINQNSGAGG